MIHIENLKFSYDSKHKLFNGLNLQLPLGNIYGLLGKNGAGKSTLLKLISGLLFAQEGIIKVNGYMPKLRQPTFLSEIFMVCEEFSLPSITCERYINLYSPFYPQFNYNLFNEYCNEFKLPRDIKLTELSYGQRKNFLLSFGLATECKLLILDEPTNGLDIPSKSKFRKIIANAINSNRSFIISTHQVRDMENLIDPIIILDEGEIVFNEYYEQITNKLTITRTPEKPEKDNTIYYEEYLGGYTVIKENTGVEETKMNIELLFNAIINNNDKISELFNNKRNEGE